MEEINHNEDGRPLVQIFYDELWLIIKKYEDSGMTNAEMIGVFEMLKYDQLATINSEEEEED
jgi:hypothetical protein